MILIILLTIVHVTDSYKLFSFGIISDIQYSSFPDSANFQGTKIRRYKNSLDIYKQALKTWQSADVSFSLVLGDIIDGRAGRVNDHHHCLHKILHAAENSHIPLYFCFGNHCHYCFSRRELHSLIPAENQCSKQLHNNIVDLQYSWTPYAGWRFISIDSYELSTIGARTEQDKEVAGRMLSQRNPNDLTLGQKWSKNLPEHRQRWLPYNGGLTEQQLLWLDNTLKLAFDQKERVILLCHQSVFAPNRQNSLIWNSEEVLRMLWKYDNIVMWIAGHDHAGKAPNTMLLLFSN